MDLSEASNPEYASLTTAAIATMFASIHMTPLVTIAVVQGAAIAGGAGLAAACDFVIAEENTFFSFPETRRGLVAALVAALLMRQLSTRHIKELLLFGIKINSKRAYEIGLVNRVVTKNESLVEEAFKYAEEVLLGAPQATQKTKELIDALYPFSYEQMTNLAMQYHKEAKLSEEAQEGIEAFFNKRIPRWNQK